MRRFMGSDAWRHVFVGDRIIKLHAWTYTMWHENENFDNIVFYEELFAYVVVFVSGVIIFRLKFWGTCL